MEPDDLAFSEAGSRSDFRSVDLDLHRRRPERPALALHDPLRDEKARPSMDEGVAGSYTDDSPADRWPEPKGRLGFKTLKEPSR